MPAELVFWIAVWVPLYAFLGYPLVLLALRLGIHRAVRKSPIHPFVSLLIPAYNEARTIARKIENSLALDYPRRSDRNRRGLRRILGSDRRDRAVGQRGAGIGAS